MFPSRNLKAYISQSFFLFGVYGKGQSNYIFNRLNPEAKKFFDRFRKKGFRYVYWLCNPLVSWDKTSCVNKILLHHPVLVIIILNICNAV